MNPQTTSSDVARGTVSSILIRTATDRVKVYTKIVSDSFVTGSLKTNAIMRGVSCPLASCTATSRVEERNTMKVSIDPARIPMTVRMDSGEYEDSQSSFLSIVWNSQAVATAAAIPNTGRTTIEFRM